MVNKKNWNVGMVGRHERDGVCCSKFVLTTSALITQALYIATIWNFLSLYLTYAKALVAV